MAAPSQKAADRPFTFSLADDSGIGASLTLNLRPESMESREPGLQTATPTFGGAFVDDFGPGIGTIKITGNTGWNSGPGWEEAFRQLRTTVWDNWHQQRAAANAEGRSPDSVKLIYTDRLDSICAVVMPGEFITRRSKDRPLLMMYDINMTVLSYQIAPSLNDPLDLTPGSSDGKISGVKSLSASLNSLKAAAARVSSFVDASIAQPVRSFMNKTNSVLGSVLDAVNTVEGVAGQAARQYISIASDLAQTGRNAFYALSQVAGLPATVLHDLGAVASAYENAFCVLKNAFRVGAIYEDYSGIYGASNCSSTVGGSALSPYLGVNTFEAISNSVSIPVSVSVTARDNITSMKISDPILSPMSIGEVGSRLGQIASGIL